MAGNQQFCLRWNNHQSTLISVFDNLLESGTLVDCTLAAEGQYLKAHKVVLSACSPFFEGLFSQHYEKHPIIILKDVTFAELKAMLDYMYRGEVNISQDQLGTFLKAAESLQIKGLTDSSGNGDLYRKPPPEPRRIIMPPLSKSPSYPTTATALLQAGIQNMQALSAGLVVEPRPPSAKLTNNNVDSPPRRKRRLSEESLPDVPASALVQPHCTVSEPPDDYLKSSNQVKSEKSDSVNNDESGDDTAPYPEEEEEEEMDLSKPGTSSTPNSHPPGAWNANSAENTSDEQFPPGGSQEQDNRWMVVTRPLVQSLKAAMTTTAAPSTGLATPGGSGLGRGGGTPNRNISCPTCHKFYSSQHTLRRHIRLECGKEPQFHCPYCPRKTKQRYNLMLHIARAHKPEHMQPLW